LLFCFDLSLLGQTQVASLRPSQELLWQRVSPSVEKPDGPVLYQILFRSSATPGSIPKISTSFTLTNSLISEDGAGVHIGALAIASNGAITLCCGQSFGSGGTGGTMTLLNTGTGLTGGPVTTSGTVSIANGGVTTTQISSGAAINGQVLMANGSGAASWQTLGSLPSNTWGLHGNFGIGCTASPCTRFLGTADSSNLEFRVNDQRALRIEPQIDPGTGSFAPNMIGGFTGNVANGAAVGATIAGGGEASRVNTVGNSFTTIGGGVSNTASGEFAVVSGGMDNAATSLWATVSGGSSNTASNNFATVAGGQVNTASGFASFAAGSAADTNNHAGSFLWADNNVSHQEFLKATADNQFMVRATGGFDLIAGIDGNGNPDPAKTVNIAADSGALGIGVTPFARLHVSSAGGIPQAELDQTAAGDFSRLRFVLTGSPLWDIAVGGSNDVMNFFKNGAGNIMSLSGAGNPLTMINGAFLSSGGTWTNASDRNAKTNFAAIDTRQILERLSAIPVQSWNYKAEAVSIRHIGPMAQDFFAAFNLGEDDKHITTIDEGGIALAAIQGLNQKLEENTRQLRELVQQKDALLATQQQQIERLEQQVTALLERVTVVEKPARQLAGRIHEQQ